jgi:predicted RNase H-like HicB family nuclease
MERPMSTILFVALVTGDPAAGYSATFVDLPGVAPEGRDLADLLVNARRAALNRLQALTDAGEAWPDPTPVEKVAVPKGAIAILVDVTVDDPPVRINISLGERLVQRLDAAAEARGMTRSGFIAQSVRVSLGERPKTGADFDAASRRLLDELAALGERINESLGPNSAFARHMADFDDMVSDEFRKAADSVSAAMSRRREARKAASPPRPEPPRQ